MKSSPASNFLVSILLLSLAFGSAGPTWAETAPKAPAVIPASTLIERVDTFYNRLHSFSANFTETYQGMGIHREERGTLLLRKPGKMRWNYDQPPGKVFIINGKYAWFYSPGDPQAQRIDVKKMNDLRSPLRFLLGHTHLKKEFDHLALTRSDAGLVISGVPKGMENRISTVDLGVTPNGAIHSMVIRETGGATTSFTFTNIRPDIQAPEREFVFHPPAGIPVVNGLPPV